MSNFYDFVKALPVYNSGKDYVRKTASARELVMQLPSPENYERMAEQIPDVPVKLILSTTDKLPEFIKSLVKKSKDKIIFGDDSLAGLCMSGRGMPIEIFLHDVLIMQEDISGNSFEEIFWHEYVHGAEGIGLNAQEVYDRETPWSYNIQSEMLKIDQDLGHDPFLNFKGSKKIRALLEYFRKGTELQENVSEIFARAACAYMITVRETKLAPEFGNCSILFPEDGIPEFSKPIGRNLREFYNGIGTFSDKAQEKLGEESPMMMAMLHYMYGCKIPDA